MMLCTNCDARNEDNARFCRACGTPFAVAPPTYAISDAPMTGPVCAACRQANPTGARYCVYCANALVVAAPTSPAPVTRRLWQAPPMAPSPVHAAPGQAVANNSVTIVNNGPPLLFQVGVASLGTDLLIRAIWFFFIGWWLGLFWTFFAWLFNLTLIGMPVGAMMLNAIPMVTTLHHRRQPQYYAASTPLPQHPLALRAIWFVLVGWWASFLWLLVAWGLATTLIFMPIAFWMYNRVATITTLAAER